MKVSDIVSERTGEFRPQESTDEMMQRVQLLVRQNEELIKANNKLLRMFSKETGNLGGTQSSSDIRDEIENAIGGQATSDEMTRPEARPYGR